MIDETNAKAAAKLQMPPVMDIREEIDEVLSKDPELQYYLDSKLVFIDTSPSKTARVCFICLLLLYIYLYIFFPVVVVFYHSGVIVFRLFRSIYSFGKIFIILKSYLTICVQFI